MTPVSRSYPTRRSIPSLTAVRNAHFLDYSAEHGIYTFAYGTLAGGFLAERYMGKEYEAPETRSQVKYMQIIEDSLGWDGMQKLPVLKAIADNHGVSIANGNPVHLKPEERRSRQWSEPELQTRSNIQTLEFDLTAEEMKTIRDFIDQYPTPRENAMSLSAPLRDIGIILTDRNHVDK